MDYEVFLLSRIRERRAGPADTARRCRTAWPPAAPRSAARRSSWSPSSGRFALTGVPVIQEVGLGAAVAIAIDATIVRLVLVPAAIALMGDRRGRASLTAGRTRAPEIVH